ncbi:hypothetical protein BTVI_41728 [Pitangus sulphuratus]|nr:hypothetical protein BTVI_41728 [Pitangus sulphuratus]
MPASSGTVFLPLAKAKPIRSDNNASMITYLRTEGLKKLIHFPIDAECMIGPVLLLSHSYPIIAEFSSDKQLLFLNRNTAVSQEKGPAVRNNASVSSIKCTLKTALLSYCWLPRRRDQSPTGYNSFQVVAESNKVSPEPPLLQVPVPQYYRITEYAGLEGTHKDYRVQLLNPAQEG